VAGVSTLEALAAGTPGALALIDGGRREVFAALGGVPISLRAEHLVLEPGTPCVGDGAVRYRAVLEAAGALVPPDDSDVHVPHARLHARIALAKGEFSAADTIEPVYVRAPDAKVPA
jgi:tRNA A37 threonylcarbamoyladenosine modification protein TsaB